MSNRLHKIVGLFGVAVAIALIISIMVPLNPDSDERKTKVGNLAKITLDSSTGDVNLYLDDASDFYYINRGLQQKIPLEKWKEAIGNRPIKITYYSSGRNLFGSRSHHIYQLSYNDSIFYNELK